MDPQLKAACAQTIYVASESGRNDSGDPSWGTPAAVEAYVTAESKIVEMQDGDRRETTHLIITESAIGLTDRVWMPGDSSADSTLAHTPATVTRCIGEVGDTTHYETRI